MKSLHVTTNNVGVPKIKQYKRLSGIEIKAQND